MESCRHALLSDDGDNLHLLERININLQVQNSIVPTAYSLARFKVAGSLPSLSINLSDTKYKSLMKLIDVCIPKFDDATSAVAPPSSNRNPSGAFQGLFGQKGEDYTVALDEDKDEKAKDTPKSDVFFLAPDGNTEASRRTTIGNVSADRIAQRPELRQHIFELNFRVDELKASLFKTVDGTEKLLGNVSFDQFALAFAMAKYDMQVDVNLR